MNGLFDNIMVDIRSGKESYEFKEKMSQLIIKYNTNLLDFLEHKLTLE